MKVIKEGRPQKGWAKELECTGAGNSGKGTGCGAILLVDEGDVFQTSRQAYCDPYPEYYVTFRCPGCGSLTDISNPPITGSGLPTEKELLARRSLQPRDT